jgi:hypothetical protein
VDISSINSLKNLLAQTGMADAVICAAGDSVTSDLLSMTDEKYFTGEMPRGIRINVISPSKITDIATEDLIKGYLKSIATSANGEIIRIGYN